MTSRKELFKAINTIVDYCRSQDKCYDCPFYKIGYCGCVFLDGSEPTEWNIKMMEGKNEEEN